MSVKTSSTKTKKKPAPKKSPSKSHLLKLRHGKKILQMVIVPLEENYCN
jgi:hypothetical protein